MTMTSAWAPIFKSEEQDDGTIFVYGKATDDSLDRDHQRCDPNWLNEAMPAWFKTGANVREMHDSKRAVGVGVQHDIASDGHYVKAHVVDPISVLKVKHGVLKGFSIGIRDPKIINVKSAEAPNGVIAGGSVVELSLCDRPSNPGCLVQLAKSAKPGMQVKAGDFDSKRLLVRCEELIEKSVEPDARKDAEADMTVTLAEQPTEEQTEQLAEKATDVEEGAGPEATKDDGDDQAKSADVDTSKATPFDRDAAKALVARLVRADDASDASDSGDDEQSDIDGAQAAIAIIAQLIASEAADLADNPVWESCDIDLLQQALRALTCFQRREQAEQDGTADDEAGMLMLAAEAELEKAKYSAEQLRQMLKDGKAIANANGDPSYPIGDKEDLENAIHAVGRGSGDHDAIRTHIKRRAAALGASDMIPENWTSGGSSKAADTKETVVDTETIEAAKTTEPEAAEAAEPEVAKAAVIEVDPDTLEKAIAAALEKAMPVALEKADNPLRKSLEAIIEASTRSTADQLGELGSRLERVEGMAVPGGPALRRTEVERKQARKADLQQEAARLKALAYGAEDRDLRSGYAKKAAQLEAEIKTLAA